MSNLDVTARIPFQNLELEILLNLKLSDIPEMNRKNIC